MRLIARLHQKRYTANPPECDTKKSCRAQNFRLTIRAQSEDMDVGNIFFRAFGVFFLVFAAHPAFGAAQKPASAQPSSANERDVQKPALPAKKSAPARKKARPDIKFSPSNPYEDGETDFSASKNPIDAAVADHLTSRGLKPAKRCSDAVFIRRATLDIAGRIPTAEEVEKFLDDRSPRKREVLVDSLLASEDFVEYMSLRLGDILRIKAEFPITSGPTRRRRTRGLSGSRSPTALDGTIWRKKCSRQAAAISAWGR